MQISANMLFACLICLASHQILGRTEQEKLRWRWSKLCAKGDLREKAQKLFSAGLAPNAQYRGETVIHEALIFYRSALIEEALEYGADPNWPNPKGILPLSRAICSLLPKVVRALLAHGADINKKGPNGRTPLETAQQVEINLNTHLINPSPTELKRIHKIVNMLREHAQAKAQKN